MTRVISWTIRLFLTSCQKATYNSVISTSRTRPTGNTLQPPAWDFDPSTIRSSVKHEYITDMYTIVKIKRLKKYISYLYQHGSAL